MNKLISRLLEIHKSKFILLLSILFTLEIIVLFILTPHNNLFFDNCPGCLKGDQSIYDWTGYYLSEGAGFIDKNFKPMPGQIGYPLFLSLNYIIFGHTSYPIILLQIILLFLSFYLSLKIASFLSFNNVQLLLVALPLYLNYKIILSSFLIMSEILSVFLIISFIFYVFKYLKTKGGKYIWLSGFLLGYLILTRPIFQFLPIFLALIILIYHFIKQQRINYKLIFIILVIPLFITAIYQYRNYKTFGFWGISVSGGQMLYSGTNIKYDGLWPGGEKVQKDLHFKIKKYNIKELIQYDNLAKKEALKNIKQNIPEVGILYFKNILRILIGYPYPGQNLGPENIIYLICNLLYLIVFVLVFFYLVLFKCKFNQNMIILFLIFFYYIGISGVFSPSPRYGFIPDIIIYIIAPFGLNFIKIGIISNSNIEC